MSRLMSPVDAVFLAVEKARNPIHVAGLHVFEHSSEASRSDDDAQHVRDWFATDGTLSGFFGQRPVRGWETAGQWRWDDHQQQSPSGQLFEHALAAPHDLDQLFTLCAQLHAAPLDRSRPLWEAHLITGLVGGGFALYVKVHHALGDGMRLQRLLRESLSTDPDHRGSPPPWLRADTPASNGSSGPRSHSARSLLSELAGLPPVLGRALERGLNNKANPIAFTAPRSALNPAAITGSRAFAAASWPLNRLQAIRRRHGVSSNDVVLALCAGALRDYLTSIDAEPSSQLIGMVPVALRDVGPLGASGNAVGAVMCPLGTDLADSVARLRHIHRGMQAGKSDLASMTPVQILALTAVGLGPLLLEPVLGRIAGTRPPFNLIISNVPGAREPLYLNGAPLAAVYPMSVLLDGQALNITCTTYADRITFGITACPDVLPGTERLVHGIEQELLRLEAAPDSR